ncbi:MAG: type II secretion system F family protein [Elusimicrobiota bacterium]
MSPRFSYRAKRGPQGLVRGVVEADSRKRALDMIRDQGYFPVAVEEESRPRFRRVRMADVALFTRHLSDLLDSGLPLLKALEVLQRQTENKRFATLLGEVQGQVKEGKALSAAMADHPAVFPPVYTSVLKAGELGGAVATVLDRLAGFYEEEIEFRSRLQSAAAYPLLVALVGVGTIGFLLTFVIPKLGEMFGEMGASLPWITRLLLDVGNHWRGSWWAWLLGLTLVGAAWWRVGPKGGIAWRLPVWGPIAYKAAVARFSQTLATLVANGVPLMEALRVVSKSVGHPRLQAQIDTAADAVENGSSLAAGLQGHLPEFVCHMIAVGEEGGKLERSLEKVAAAYGKDFERTVRLVTSMLEPTMILCVGSMVGLMVLAMLLPILQIHVMVK